MRIFTILAALLFAVSGLKAQLVCGLGAYQGEHIGCEHGLQGTGVDQFTQVPPPANFVPDAERSVIISVIYNGFPTNAQAAFDYAVDIWASQLTSSVPIIVEANWASLSGGTLGFAGAENYFRNFPGAPLPDTFYPAALANKLRGQDNSITNVDISCTFNSNANWYFGTDGNTPGGQYDFVTVVLHELCHGLGFIGSASVSGGVGTIGLAGDPIIYDVFVEELDGTDILNYSSGTTALGNALTSNQLYWNGPEGISNNSGTRPRIYAPGTWNGGSSYSHLNEGTYGSGNINALMTPFIGTAESHHDPGPIVYGMFTDIGWTVGGCEISNVSLGAQSACNPVTNNYSQTITFEYVGQPANGLIIVNGSLFTIQGSPQTVTLQNLPSDGQPVDLSISFSQDAGCEYFEAAAFTAPEACCTNVRITGIDTDLKRITLTNYGSCTQDMTSIILSSQLSNATVGGLNLVSGSLALSSGASLTVQWNAWNPAPTGADMALYPSGANFLDPADIIDFVQWSSGGNGREAIADAAGIWVAGTFVTNISPYTYIGDGSQYGVEFWEGTPPPCSIDSFTLGTQTACDPTTGTYSQEVTIDYTSEPAAGDLVVNGISLPINGSPQTVTLTDLASDGQPVDLTAIFTADPGCNAVFTRAFVAPANCFCPADIDGSSYIDIADFLLFLADYGCTSNCSADLNGDGIVSSDDLLQIISAFDTPCP